MNRTSLPCLLLASACFFGCASSVPQVPPVRYAQLSELKAPQLPMVVEFAPGDEIPVYPSVRTSFVETRTTTPTILAVKRKFYLVITRERPPRVSFDGVSYAETHGTLSLGLGINKERGRHATVVVEAQ